MAISVKQDSYAHSGLEVYLTKEPEVEVKKIDSSEDSEENKEDTSTEDSDSELNSDEKFKLLNGETVQIDYYDEMFDNSYEYDYEDISCNANVSMPRVDKNFYKGKKLALLKKWQAPEQKLKWKDLEKVIIGFITEQTYTEDGVQLKIAGITKLLDQEKEFNFSQRKISEILTEMIEAAGLKADVNPKGLKDDVIDYTNISSSSDDDSGGYTGEVSADIAEAAKQICKGKNTCLGKAKAIWKWCHDNMSYEGYPNSQKGAEGCFRDRAGNCCDHANVVVQMLRAVNVKCAYEHSTSCYGTGHVWAVATCEGQDYRIDAAVKSRDFNEVGDGCTGIRKENINF